MKIAFRTDASVQIGIGHVMRCLTLAEQLRGKGAECWFICRDHEGNLIAQITERGFQVRVLPKISTKKHISDLAGMRTAWLGAAWQEDAEQTTRVLQNLVPDWLVVDQYAVDIQWEVLLRPHCRKLMVIDDLADRRHDCDLLLDQNFYFDKDQRYKGLLPDQCVTLLGPEYVLLRNEFSEAQKRLRNRDGSIERILVFFGGTDPTNQTAITINALKEVRRSDLVTDVVVGGTNANRFEIQELCKDLPNTNFHCNVSNMAELISNADLGIGAGGSAMWERCFLGLPTITVVFADNQVRTTQNVAEIGAIEYIGCSDELQVEDYKRAIESALVNPGRIKDISNAALAIVRSNAGRNVAGELCRLLSSEYSI